MKSNWGFHQLGRWVLRNIVSISDGTAEVQDDASRIGINLNTFGAIKVFGTAESGRESGSERNQFERRSDHLLGLSAR